MRKLEDGEVVPDRSFDQLARAAAMVLDVGVVVISVVDDRAHRVLGSFGLLIPQPPADLTCRLCHSVALAGRPVVVQLAAHRIPAGARRGWGVEFMAYAGVPLSPSGAVLGTLAAMSTTRRTWHQRDLDVLRTMAAAAAAVLELWHRCEQGATR